MTQPYRGMSGIAFLFVIPQRSRGSRRAAFARWGGAAEESACVLSIVILAQPESLYWLLSLPGAPSFAPSHRGMGGASALRREQEASEGAEKLRFA